MDFVAVVDRMKQMMVVFFPELTCVIFLYVCDIIYLEKDQTFESMPC
jgi:hypothetical protein